MKYNLTASKLGEVLSDQTISLSAKGMYMTILSKQHGEQFEFSAEYISKFSSDGKELCEEYLEELYDAGHIINLSTFDPQ